MKEIKKPAVTKEAKVPNLVAPLKYKDDSDNLKVNFTISVKLGVKNEFHRLSQIYEGNKGELFQKMVELWNSSK